jgi:branched-chain amino acid transport system substrate-binding protein
LAGDANNGIVSADITFPDLPPFASIPANIEFVAAHKKAFRPRARKERSARRRPLQIRARAVEQTKSLDKKTVAEAIRGRTIKGTLFGDATSC